MKFVNAIITLSLFFTSQLSANDAALYDPKPNKDSSFVRLVNTADTKQTLQINGKKTRSTDAYSVSPYIALDAGSYQISIGVTEKEITIPSNHKYTLFIQDNQIRFVEQAKNTSKKSARIAFLNLSEQPLSLTTQNNKSVFEQLGKYQAIERDVNPMKLNFVVKNDNQAIVADVNGVSMKRGFSSDIITFNTALGTKALTVNSEW